jgi:hypothetical protein
VQASRFSIDKITKFSLRPPELRLLFDTVKEYFRWFEYTSKTITGEQLNDCLSANMKTMLFVDCMMVQVKVRLEAFPEILDFLDELETNIDFDHSMTPSKREAINTMVSFFRDLERVFKTDYDDLIRIEDQELFDHAMREIVISHEPGYHLPVPVFSYTKPTMGVQFLIHLLLSLGHFQTEIDLTSHATIRECMQYAKLIGE